MNTLFMLEASQYKGLYSLVSKSKDNIDMILEPLQCMIQLALLSVSQIGTKLTIQNNILYLQNPCLTQPISRWYNSDKKDNLYFLFSVIKRFTLWYNPTVNAKSPISIDVYQLLLKMSLKGFDNLIKTYSSSDNAIIIQVILMYRTILEFGDNFSESNSSSPTLTYKSNPIDTIFINIIDLYDYKLINSIYNILLIIDSEKEITYIHNYISGINNILTKNNKLLHEWIKVNLII
jgi:hypothetical protein